MFYFHVLPKTVCGWGFKITKVAQMSNWIIRLLQAFYSLSDSGVRLRVLMGMIPLKRRENICLPLFGSRGELIQTCINKKFQMHCCQRWAQTGGKYVFHVIPQLESRVKEHKDITNTLYNLGGEYRTELSLSWIECQINLLLGLKQLVWTLRQHLATDKCIWWCLGREGCPMDLFSTHHCSPFVLLHCKICPQ